FPSWHSGGNKCGACGRTMEEVQCDSQSFHRCCFLHMVWRKNLVQQSSPELWLGSGVAVPVAWAGSCSSFSS
uniref:LIM zinc-binding domain-containing protein n=1 Tax=Sus scrofa TaxID=9823 RepID=A0A8D1C181_PIG